MKTSAKRQPAVFRRDFLRPFQGVPSHSLYPEFLAVAAGLKPVLRTYAVRLDRCSRLAAALAACGLRCERSDFRISGSDDTSLDPAGPSVYVYVSLSARLAAAAKRCEERMLGRREPSYAASLEFSRLMGYPRCCFDAFLRFVRGAPGRDSHFMEYAALRRTKGAPSWLLNNLIRGDHYLISHYPCSYRCRPSAKYAAALLAAMRARLPAAAARLEALLRQPVLKFDGKGSYLRLAGGAAAGGGISYAGCGGEAGLVRLFGRGDSMRPLKARVDIYSGADKAGSYRRKSPDDGTAYLFE